MTQFIPGATVAHIPEEIEYRDSSRTDFAVAHCGATGEPVTMDPDEDSICENCKSEYYDE